MSSLLFRSARRSWKMIASNATGDWSRSCSAMSCWPAMVRTGAVDCASTRSVLVTDAASAVWTAVAVPVETFGRLMLSVPDGSAKFWHRFAVVRPNRGRSTYSSIR
jgi:hypothetical protein